MMTTAPTAMEMQVDVTCRDTGISGWMDLDRSKVKGSRMGGSGWRASEMLVMSRSQSQSENDMHVPGTPRMCKMK
jgi:hypothetical protein